MMLAITTRNLFPTPVASAQTPDADARNAELRALILDRRRTAATLRASNEGGWHSERDMLTWGGPRTAEIITMARGMANHLTRDRAGREVQPDWIATAWANVNLAGDANACHFHPRSVWSGTYYVDDGGVNADPAMGGVFEMLDPRGAAPAMVAPGLAYAGDGGLSAGGSEWIRPRDGLIVLFPSWLQHQVRTYRGTRERISIAFNLAV